MRKLTIAVLLWLLPAQTFAGSVLDHPKQQASWRQQFWLAYAAEQQQLPSGVPPLIVVTPASAVNGAGGMPDSGIFFINETTLGFRRTSSGIVDVTGNFRFSNNASSLSWTSRSAILSPADGAIELLNNAGTDFSVLQFGGTTASQPALQKSGATLRAVVADQSGFATFTAGNVTIPAGGTFQMTTTFAHNTAPSAPSSCGTTPAVTNNNGTVVMTITGGTGGAATGCTVTMPSNATGWTCYVQNRTADAANRADRKMVQTADTTTSVTFQYQVVSTGAATAFTASDVFKAICMGY